jgi:hypothetical protein
MKKISAIIAALAVVAGFAVIGCQQQTPAPATKSAVTTTVTSTVTTTTPAKAAPAAPAKAAPAKK